MLNILGDLLAFVVKKWLWLGLVFSFAIVEDLRNLLFLSSLLYCPYSLPSSLSFKKHSFFFFPDNK